MSFVGIDQDLIDECRADMAEYLTATATVLTRGSAAAVPNSRGGIKANDGGLTGGVVEGDSFDCRIQSTRPRISMGEGSKGVKPGGQDEGLLVAPWNQILNNRDKLEIVTADGFTSIWEITQQMEQSEGTSRLFAVIRVS